MEPNNDTFLSLFWGYTVIWGILGAYIVSLGRRVKRMEKVLRERNQ